MKVKSKNSDEPQLWLEEGYDGDVLLLATGTDGENCHLMSFLKTGHYELIEGIGEEIGFSVEAGYLVEIGDA